MKTTGKSAVVCALAPLVLCLPVSSGCRSTPPPPAAQEPELLKLSGDLDVHDPAMIREKKTCYIFCTGGGWREGIVPIRTSTDMLHWTRSGSVFQKLPDWVAKEAPLARGIWAPDISCFNGSYHLYYAVSSFGVNKSAIGLAINKTLDPSSPRYQWVDQGLVVRSEPGIDDFNAIDPNIVVEDKRHVWLCWGSFWDGIKMQRIDPKTGRLSAADTAIYSLARRPRLNSPQTPPAEGAVEAPFIARHGDYWYLFASYDFCCRGTNSTYKIKVGRARKITGPYLDRDGKSLTDDGGTVVVEAATPRWRGAGGESVFSDRGRDYLVFHAYDGQWGFPQLQISTIVWEDGWPRAAKMP